MRDTLARLLALFTSLGSACANFDRHVDASAPPDVPALPTPPAEALANVVHVGAGRWHTCAVESSGAVRCWGLNNSGQVGTATSAACASMPCVLHATTVEGVTGAARVGGGSVSTCARDGGGRVYCWGDNTHGQLGLTDTPSRVTPSSVPGLPALADLAVGGAHACGRAMDGPSVHCWGYGEIGQFGDGMRPVMGRPATRIDMLAGAAQLFAGDAHGCVADASGRVRCWGSTAAGQVGVEPGEDCTATALGRWPTRCVTMPLAVQGLASGVAELALGFNHTCARLGDGSVWCWGSNEDGQLGSVAPDAGCTIPSDSTEARGVTCSATPVRVGLPVAAERIWTGMRANHTCARGRDGALRCWGSNSAGQLGDGTTADSLTPRVALVGARVVELAAGEEHTCAVVAGARVVCWGGNRYGQLATGDTRASTRPVYARRAP
jgi:alpha-tubulin suppressor-like RCC1 family protein